MNTSTSRSLIFLSLWYQSQMDRTPWFWWMWSVQRGCTSLRAEIDAHPPSPSTTLKLENYFIEQWSSDAATTTPYVPLWQHTMGCPGWICRNTLLFWLISGGKIESNKSPDNLHNARAALIYSKENGYWISGLLFFFNFTWTDKSYK